jgi:uncharacterized protein YdbL (DUF1318 family)
MRITLMLFLVVFLSLGCARVRVEAPEKPIKVDISMRLDIYQHIEKDINAIEDIVSGPKENVKTDKDKQSMLGFFIAMAYAEDLSPEVQQAAYRRKDRRDQLSSLEAQGIVGENKSGLVVVRNPAAADAPVQDLVNAENSDRMIIYQSVAKKNGSSVEEVQKLYAKRLQADAPSGTPIESADGWAQK